MVGSVPMFPYSDENQGGMRPSSQGFSNHLLPGNNPNPPEKVQASPIFTFCCKGITTLLLLKINLFPKLTAKIQLEPIFQTRGCRRQLHNMWVKKKKLGI